MKKFLYGTTALAAVGLAAGPVMAAEPLHYELGGYYQTIVGFGDSDFASNGSTNPNFSNSYNNIEVYFKMRGELDNGLKIGGRIELEGENSSDQIDQTYLTLAGGFGSFRIGSINSGRYSYGWNTDGPNVGVPINSGWVSNFVPPQGGAFSFRTPSVSTVIDLGNDDQRVTYFSPRFSGFQFTASWAPDPVGSGGESSGLSDEDSDYTNGFDVGVSYSGEFSGLALELQGGLGTGSAPDLVDDVAGFSDYFAYNGGIWLGYQGFSIAGSFAVVEDGEGRSCTSATAAVPVSTSTSVIGLPIGATGLAITGTTTLATIIPGSAPAAAACAISTEGQSYNFGIGYSTGPFGFSATYFHGETEDKVAVKGDTENEFFAVAASYSIGPGIRTHVTYLHAELDTDDGLGDNEGDWVLLGIALGF